MAASSSSTMQPSTSTGLLIGLGLRIIVDRLLHLSTGGSPLAQNLLLGVWQGVLLFYVTTSAPQIFTAVCGGVGARFVVDLFVLRDIVHSCRSLLGLPIGALLASLCAFFWEDDVQGSAPVHRRGGRLSAKLSGKKKHRTLIPRVQLDAISEEGSDLSSLAREQVMFAKLGEEGTAVASLKAQAAAAEGDRRRFQEERKWAISQGNWARASQLGWQIRKYEALRDSFEREARLKAHEARKHTRDTGITTTISQPSSIIPPGYTLREIHPRGPEIIFETFDITRPSSAPPSIYGDIPSIRIENPSDDNNTLPTPPESVVSPAEPSPEPQSPKAFDPKDFFRRRPRTASFPSSQVPHASSHHFGHGPGYGVLNFIHGTDAGAESHERRNSKPHWSHASAATPERAAPAPTIAAAAQATRPFASILVPNYTGSGLPEIILSHYSTRRDGNH